MSPLGRVSTDQGLVTGIRFHGFQTMRFQRKGFVVHWDSVLEPFCAFLWFSLGCLAGSSSVLNLITATIWKQVGCQHRGLLVEPESVDRRGEPV